MEFLCEPKDLVLKSQKTVFRLQLVDLLVN